ncbi:ABC transporter permease subunit [Streptomyces sp. NPDC048710]|uniref:ABC transporter permease subunit n=1 Tax=Streptomyces sp. NPDC048710 TaxID=3365586 RepID=UPI003716087D
MQIESDRPRPRPWTLSPSLDSVRRVFGQQEFGRYFANSVVVAGSLVIASAAIAFLAATAAARFRFRFRTTLLIKLRGFVKAVPEALEEAAYLDGASRGRFLWQILFPLVFPGLVATSVFSFISAWNDFLFAKSFVIGGTSQSTLPMALLVFFVLVQRRLVSGLGGAVKD